MRIHYPDGTPFDPQDALSHFRTRLETLEAFAESFERGYPHANGEKYLVQGVISIMQDFQEMEATVDEYFDRLPAEAALADIGGWGSDKPLRPRRSAAKEAS